MIRHPLGSAVEAGLAILFLGLTATGAIAAGPVGVPPPAEDCHLSLEISREWRSLRIRSHHPNLGFCAITAAAMRSLLQEHATELAASDPPFTALSLGRLAEYPWLSRRLAEAALADPGWNKTTGRPRRGYDNNYVAALLYRPEFLAELNDALAGSNYQITDVSVEKVLINRLGDQFPDAGRDRRAKIPFDALIWLHLKRH